MRASNQFADVTTGVVYIHASPAAVCPHVEWALSSTLQSKANLVWTPQPAMPGQLRAVTNWCGPVGTGSRLANALRSWSVLRFEVTEDPSPGVDGQRFSHTPQLGLWSGAMSANGDIMVGEMRLRTLMAQGADTLPPSWTPSWAPRGMRRWRLTGTAATPVKSRGSAAEWASGDCQCGGSPLSAQLTCPSVTGLAETGMSTLPLHAPLEMSVWKTPVRIPYWPGV